MKKKIFLVSALVMMAMSAMFISCEKEESISDGCKCTYKLNGQSYTQYVSSMDMAADGIYSCSALTAAYRAQGAQDASCR